MGHWSVKCAVTSLPIKSGDDVVLLLGAKFKDRKGSDTGGYIWQGHFFNLLAPPLFGKYDEYGWIEDGDAVSLQFAYEALQLIYGQNGDKRNDYQKEASVIHEGARVPEKMIDIRENVHWSDLQDQFQAFVHDNYDYTFVHRTVWDRMIEQAAKCFHGDFHLYSREDDTQEKKAATKLIKDTFARHGLKLGNYSPYGFPQQFFAGCRELWGTDLVNRKTKLEKLIDDGIISREEAVKVQELQKNDDDLFTWLNELTKTDPERGTKVTKAVIAMTMDTLRDMDYDTDYSGMFSRQMLGFFEHVEQNRGGYRRKTNVPYVDGLLQLAAQGDDHQAREQLLIDTQLFYTALLKGGIVVRGHTDMPSEQQDGGPYWPHMAVMRGACQVLVKRAERQAEYSDDEVEPDLGSDAKALEYLAKDGLDESYEFN